MSGSNDYASLHMVVTSDDAAVAAIKGGDGVVTFSDLQLAVQEMSRDINKSLIRVRVSAETLKISPQELYSINKEFGVAYIVESGKGDGLFHYIILALHSGRRSSIEQIKGLLNI